MSLQTVEEGHRSSRWSWRSQRIVAAVVFGVALVVAACGTTTTPGGETTPTATVKPTPTATPVPCSTWRIIPSPNASQYQMNVLSAVSAVSPSAAWAVGGNYGEGGPRASLIERWDGTSWQVVSNSGVELLTGVAAIAPNDVWAVGGDLNYGAGYHPYMPLIEHWNGTQWVIVSTPASGANAVALNAVAAVAANNVWAVGRQDVGAQHTTRPLIERWNGSAWQIISSPDVPGAQNSAFTAITKIPGTQQLWAVGYASATSGYAQALIERWDGSAWQIVASPALPSGAFGSQLYGVVATSATDAWAVGNYSASNHTIRTLIAHWNGTTWQVVTSPDTWGSLFGVAATGAHDARAVGNIMSGDGNNQHMFMEQWDGSAWHIVTSPEPSGAGYSILNSISADSAGNYWVVGSTRNGTGTSQTLTLHCP